MILSHTWDNIYQKIKVWQAVSEIGMAAAAQIDV